MFSLNLTNFSLSKISRKNIKASTPYNETCVSYVLKTLATKFKYIPISFSSYNHYKSLPSFSIFSLILFTKNVNNSPLLSYSTILVQFLIISIDLSNKNDYPYPVKSNNSLVNYEIFKIFLVNFISPPSNNPLNISIIKNNNLKFLCFEYKVILVYT